MLKIGLSGIPGSGKTQLAKALKRSLEVQTSCAIVDNYVGKLEKRTDLALDLNSTYVGNLHVALERNRLERLAAKDNDVIITCGTMFETATYSAQALEKEAELTSGELQRYDLNHRVEAILRIMACFLVDISNYDILFKLSPVKSVKDEGYVELDRNLQAAFTSFGFGENVVTLPSISNSVSEVTEVRLLKALYEIQKREINEDISSGSNSESKMAE